ncbi:MAG: NAD(P)H-dependent oxidoreductase subunit E [Rhodospirillaceae bacterium]|nr:NAD(P)H-dependent oxidoreductase subunit E [Rhodospirillaceae bacterium]
MVKTAPRHGHPKGRQISPEALDRVRQLLGDGPRDHDLLIEYLHLIQDSEGHIPASLLAALADEMKLSQAEVYEVATFYAHFDVTGAGAKPPPPLTVRACGGIACEMAGAKQLIEALSQALGDKVRVIEAPCMGACEKAPAAALAFNRIDSATPELIADAVREGRTAPNDTDQAIFLDNYISHGGYTLLQSFRAGERSPESVMDEIDRSGLRGLGGAGFPVANKWRFLGDAPKPRILAVNADEGEPGTFKDRHCLETDPHRVLEGALIAAWAVGADDIYFYLRDEYPHIRQLLTHELSKLNGAGLLGDVTVHLRRGAGAYICGEETALLESLEGKRGLPRNRPPYPAGAGLFGRPTLINNVETLFWLPEILQKGADWYQGAGRPHFYSLSGRVRDPGVKLARSGITVNELIESHGGGMADGHTFKAYLPGGASGGVLPAAKGDLPLDFGTLNEYGCFIGSSAVVVLSDKDDIGAVVRNLLRFFEDESCGQCTPCRAGCEKLLQLLDAPVRDEALIRELADTMADASICGLGQAAANPLLCAMNFLDEDLK